MKHRLNIFSLVQLKSFLVSVLLLIILSPKTNAQADSTAVKTDSAAELITPLAEFMSIQHGDNSVDLKASLKAKINGTLTKLNGLKVEFFSTAGGVDSKLGEAITDRNGIALFHCAPATLVADTGGKLQFKMNFAGNKTIEASEELLAVKRGRLEMSPVKTDSLFTVNLKLIDLTSGTETPIPEADLALYVKRLFNPLKIGEGKTDESGEVSVEVPSNLPGDAKGNLFLVARLEENADYGNMEATVTQQWGKPVSEEMKAFPRALWSAAPPMWMLITFIVLMTAVWGHYFVIIYELFRLRKEH